MHRVKAILNVLELPRGGCCAHLEPVLPDRPYVHTNYRADTVQHSVRAQTEP